MNNVKRMLALAVLVSVVSVGVKAQENPVQGAATAALEALKNAIQTKKQALTTQATQTQAAAIKEAVDKAKSEADAAAVGIINDFKTQALAAISAD